ncbi:maltase A3-like isoform X3 [Chrysoperla carnea]|uniref:maltase A3-like isoform X3 n=1 Tax=Chrysoperla carnea TaxID=189513 RepID=UPI001D07E10E|nr:maltase A3-like isoform X3 [Chrysoperla carnea]
MNKILQFVFIIGIVVTFVATNPIETSEEWLAADKEWWQTAVFYQIYPRSFQDSDGDGNGDLNGIRERLPHLKDIGVTSAWLSPIYKSPQVDGGYDISDFKDIDPMFGTLEDFDKLVAEAKKLDIKIVLDFVPNHSSDKHEWFEKSIKRIEPYTSFYVWADAKIVNGTRQPPNNWISWFRKSAWEWNEERGQYYLHQFAIQQPDLNYRNPFLVEEMKNVLRFWMDRGVSGFRVDTLPSLVEVESSPDEPLNPNPGDDCLPEDHCYHDHIYTNDQPLTYDILAQWRDVLKEHSAATDKVPRVIMIESASRIDLNMRYYGNETHDGACFPFNFFIIFNLTKESDATDYKYLIENYFTYLPKGRTPNWVLGNHDRNRVGSRMGVGRIDALNMLIMTLPGVAISYNGEEIGQEDGYVSWEDTQDPWGLNAGEDRYLLFTRDPERTPLHWDTTKNAGFSTANKTWLPVSEKYKETNVKAQAPANVDSHYNVYKTLIQLRKKTTLQKGDLTTEIVGKNVLIVIRELKDNPSYISVLNLGGKTETVDLSKIEIDSDVKNLKVEVASVGAKNKKGSKILRGKLELSPNEAYVLSTDL